MRSMAVGAVLVAGTVVSVGGAEASSVPGAGDCNPAGVSVSNKTVSFAQTCGAGAKVRYKVDCSFQADKEVVVTWAGAQSKLTKLSCAIGIGGYSSTVL